MSKSKRSRWIIAGLLTMTLSGMALDIPSTSSAPKLDGELGDACWKTATTIDRMSVLKDKSGTTNDLTKIRLCRDNQWLYLAFDCANPTMKHLAKTCSEHDGAVNNDESVEIFIEPGSGDRTYYHYMLSFAEVKGERRIARSASGGADRDIGWDQPWRAATARKDDGWTAEIAVPFYALEGGDLKNAKMNFIRNYYKAVLDPYGAKMYEDPSWHTWSALEYGAHEPERFTPTRGLENPVKPPPFVPTVESAAIGGYEQRDDKAVYAVSAKIRNATETPGSVRAAVFEKAPEGWMKKAEEAISLEGHALKTLSLAIPTATFCRREVQLTLTDIATGAEMAKSPIEDTSALAVIKSAILDRNYYTTETNARVKCAFGLSETALKTCALKIRLGEKILANAASVGGETILSVPLADIPEGKNALTVTLGRDDKTLASQFLALTKLPPNQNAEVKIDQFRRVALNNDVPFFPFGMYCDGVKSADTAAFEDIAALGMNAMVRSARYHDYSWTKNDVDDAKAYLETAEKFGLQVVNWGHDIAPEAEPLGKTPAESLKKQRERYESIRANIRKEIGILKDCPNLLAYYNVDEPNLLNYDERISVAEWYYRDVASVDSYHPQFLLYARHIPAEDRATKWGEILGYDVYACPDWGGFYSDPGSSMAYFVSELERRCAKDNKVCWMVPMATALDPIRCPVVLSREQQMCQSYIAVIYGAKGLLYFTTSSFFGEDSRAAIKALATQFKDLAPALLNAKVKQDIDYSSGAVDAVGRKFPAVNVAVFQYPNGDYVALAANIRPVEVKAEIAVAGLTGVTRKFADKRLPVTDTRFADVFAPYDVRAYALTLEKPTDALTIKIAMTENPNVIAAAIPLNDIVKQLWRSKNVMPNPTLETVAAPGIPAFVLPFMKVAPDICEQGSCWFLDKENAWRGKHSLRIERRFLPSGMWKVGGAQMVCYPPKSDKPETYVFSFYAKGAKKGDAASVWLPDWSGSDKMFRFELTADWARYACSGTFQPREPRNAGGRAIFIYPASKDGSLAWFDGFQMEKGETPTEFVDDSKIVKKKVVADSNNLVANGDAESGDAIGWTGLEAMNQGDAGVRRGAGHSGEWAFEWKKWPWDHSVLSDAIEVDTKKAYALNGFFKTEGDARISVIFGLLVLDAEKRPIQCQNKTSVGGTRTTLVAPLAAGDTLLKVKDASAWKTGRLYAAAFGKAENALNFDLSPVGIREIRREKDHWLAVLEKPCGIAFPAGTTVVENMAGNNGMFFPDTVNATISNEWRELKGTIDRRQWWPGAKYVRVFIQPQKIGDNDVLLIDDVNLKESETHDESRKR